MSTANGPLKSLAIFAVVSTVVILGGTYFPGPFTAEYEVKTAAHVACNDYINIVRFKRPDDRGWQRNFTALAGKAGVRLSEEQFDFKVVEGVELECHFRAKWRSQTDIILIGDILGIPPIKLIHDLDMVHKVRRKY